MKKIFLALMAVAAIAFVGCKPQNEPDKDKDKEPEVTCTDVTVFYDVELSGKIADYVKLDIRYIEIPDSNKISVKQNVTESWKYNEFPVTKGMTVYYGIECSMRPTELFKEAIKDEAKYKAMVESGSKLRIALREEANYTDGTSKEVEGTKFGVDFSGYTDMSLADQLAAKVERIEGYAYQLTWDNDNNVLAKIIDLFWDRH